MVPVPDQRLQELANIVNPEKLVPAAMEFVDIAGLVAGASQGEGLGNKFLAHIREVDAIAHVVRCFDDGDIVHVAGKIDPLADIETINTELALADLTTVEKALERATKTAKSGDKESLRKAALFEKVRAQLNKAQPARALKLTEEEAKDLKELHLLTAKPVMYVANVDEQGFTDNPKLAAVQKLAAAEGFAGGRGMRRHRGGDLTARGGRSRRIPGRTETG